MSDIRVELNHEGIREFLHSREVTELVSGYAEEAAKILGEGYEADEYHAPSRNYAAVYPATLGTTLPTDSTTALDQAFKCVGFVSEDGVSDNLTRTTKDIKAWGGAAFFINSFISAALCSSPPVQIVNFGLNINS